MFTQFEEESLLFKTCNNKECGNKYEYNSTFAPLISEEEMYVMSSGNESVA